MSGGLAKGFTVFYLKVGIDVGAEMEMVRTVREATGENTRIRLDANGAWAVNEAIRNIAQLDRYRIDFVEQPVLQDPITSMQEVRNHSQVALCANEGLWTTEDAYLRIKSRVADVFCFSPYWVGSLTQFQALSRTAHFEGLQICKHTHGELGIAAAAIHHVLLTLPNVAIGNQQTATMMQDDLLREDIPIAHSPYWGVPAGCGIGVDVDEEKLSRYHQIYRLHGQYLPYDPATLGKES